MSVTLVVAECLLILWSQKNLDFRPNCARTLNIFHSMLQLTLILNFTQTYAACLSVIIFLQCLL